MSAEGAESETTCPPSWKRSERWILAALVAGALASLLWLVCPWYEAGKHTNDGSVYILCTQSLLRGEGYQYLGMPFTMRPPGFSMLLAPVMAWRGLDFQALHLYVSLWGVLAIALLCIFQRDRLGILLAAALAALVWLNPLFQASCNRVMSDVCAIALLYATFLLERWASRVPSWRRDLVLGVFIGLSAYVRWVNGLACLAVLCARIARRWGARERGRWWSFTRTQLILVPLTAVLVMAPWWLRNELQRGDTPIDQEFAFSYFSALFREITSDPHAPLLSFGAVFRRVLDNWTHIASSIGDLFASHEIERASVVVGAAVLALALLTAIRRRGSADFMLLGLLCAYGMAPELLERYILAVFVLAMPAALDSLVWLASFALRASRVRAALAALVLTLAGFDFAPRDKWDQIAERHRRFSETTAAVRSVLVPDAVLAATVGWHLSVYLGLPVYSLAPATAHSGKAADAERVIDRYGINTVLVVDFVIGAQGTEGYLNKRYGPGLVAGEARLYRVRP